MNVHRLTPTLNKMLPELKISNDPVDQKTFETTMTKLGEKIGLGIEDKRVQKAIGNLRKSYRKGRIIDTRLQGVNFVHVLMTVVEKADALALTTTLAEIGNTCPQGRSHRLLGLYLAVK